VGVEPYECIPGVDIDTCTETFQCCDGPEVTVNGFVGWGVGENLMSGTIRVNGNASESAGASAHGGLVAIAGDASSRAGISLKAAPWSWPATSGI
jgi:formylmethanofuran dehydrogenase subunit C